MAKSTSSLASSASSSSRSSTTRPSSSSSSSSSKSTNDPDKLIKWTQNSQVDRRKRLAANARERKRMHLLNKAYDQLRRRLVDAENKSKYDVLVQAKEYIQALASICDKFDQQHPNYQPIRGTTITNHHQQPQPNHHQNHHRPAQSQPNSPVQHERKSQIIEPPVTLMSPASSSDMSELQLNVDTHSPGDGFQTTISPSSQHYSQIDLFAFQPQVSPISIIKQENRLAQLQQHLSQLHSTHKAQFAGLHLHHQAHSQQTLPCFQQMDSFRT